jgi:hypothetical protein
VCWSIVVTEKSTVVSALFGAFPSDRTPKAAKDFMYISLFVVLPHSAITVNCTYEFWGMF